MSTAVAISLGSNLGDRREHLDWAWHRLRQGLSHARMSDVIETAPYGVPDEQPQYLNAMVVGETDATPDEVLEWLLDLERERGRLRSGFRAARILDLDLVLYGDAIIDRSGVTVPHPRFRDREFVLGPLASLAPDWIDPVTGSSVGDLLNLLRARS